MAQLTSSAPPLLTALMTGCGMNSVEFGGIESLSVYLRASYVVKNAPEAGNVTRMIDPMPWYRPRKRLFVTFPFCV